jgi:hypothetical protein
MKQMILTRPDVLAASFGAAAVAMLPRPRAEAAERAGDSTESTACWSPFVRIWSSRASEGGDYYLLCSGRAAYRLYYSALTPATRIRGEQCSSQSLLQSHGLERQRSRAYGRLYKESHGLHRRPASTFGTSGMPARPIAQTCCNPETTAISRTDERERDSSIVSQGRKCWRTESH